MSLKRIEEPPRFNSKVTEQERVDMTPQRLAIANDWSVILQKLDWVIDRIIEINNATVEHQTVVNLVSERNRTWEIIRNWSVGVLGCMGGLYYLLKIAGVIK